MLNKLNEFIKEKAKILRVWPENRNYISDNKMDRIYFKSEKKASVNLNTKVLNNELIVFSRNFLNEQIKKLLFYPER